jgi:hypothetical protein
MNQGIITQIRSHWCSRRRETQQQEPVPIPVQWPPVCMHECITGWLQIIQFLECVSLNVVE